MLIQNTGITKTVVHNNCNTQVDEVVWDANYDGKKANIYLDTNTNGKHDSYDIQLDNRDLANLLSIQGVNMPLHKRLQMDFKEPKYMSSPKQYFIEIPTYKKHVKRHIKTPVKTKIVKHISSPNTNEELIIPLTIDRTSGNKYTLTPRKRHRRHKTHVTHKVYKKTKSTPKHKSKTITRKIHTF